MTNWLAANWLEIFGVVTSVGYLYLEIKQKPQMWILGFVCSFVYIFVFFRAKIYADMSLNVYYVIISVYGFILWQKDKITKRKKENNSADTISYSGLSWKLGIILLLMTTLIYVLMVYVLKNYTDSPVPYKDSLVTALSITATWMLAKKIIQHWFIWIFVNFFSVYLFYTRGLYPTSVLFVFYGSLSVVGYLNWKNTSTSKSRKRDLEYKRPKLFPVLPLNFLKGTWSVKDPSYFRFFQELKSPLGDLGAKHIILADGLFPSFQQVQNLLREAESIVCCDGAAQKLLNFGIEPQYIVGDLDSLSKEFKQDFAQKIIQNTDQETNDLTKAVEFCISKNWKQIAILGATGLREDHTIANISLLCDYKKRLDEIIMISDFGIFTPILETTTFKSFSGQQVSIFSLNPETKLTFKGLKYPVISQSFTSWWQGTLNSSLGNSFEIILHNEGAVIVYAAYKIA